MVLAGTNAIEHGGSVHCLQGVTGCGQVVAQMQVGAEVAEEAIT